MTTEKKALLDKTFQSFMELGLSGENMDFIDDMVAKDVVGFGTTIDEKIFGVKEMRDLLIRQKEQSAGMEMNWKINTLDIHISSDENTAILTNEIILYITVDGNPIEMYMRFSVVLEYVQQKWLVVHWHGSKPEHVESEKDTWGVQTWKERAEALEKEVAARTADLVEKNRELEIEAALERVRALTMAMHNSDDVGKCIIKMFSELTALGVDEGTRFGIGILNHANENNQLWTARKDGEKVNMHIGNLDMTSHPLLTSASKAWKEQLPLHQYVLEGEDLLHYYQMINDAPDYKLRLPIEKLPDREFHYGFVFEHGFFYAFSRHAFQPELIHITQRFTALFEQTYRRYLDLVKAEEQAHEAEIELALERVRARTMAMHHSDELMETSELMFEQIKNLGIELWSCGFSLWFDDDSYFLGYNPGPHGKMGTPLRIPLTHDVFFTTIRDAKRRGDDFLVFESKGASLVQTYRYMDGLPVVGETMRGFVEAGFPLPTYQVTHCGFFANGHLMFITQEPNAEATDIFRRFTKVFNQTYTRFLDLQKAEAQAREAKIEAALERIRSKSLAMYKTDDLRDVVSVLFEQMQGLSVDMGFASVSIFIFEEGSRNIKQWLHMPDGVTSLSVPYFDHPILSDLFDARDNGADYFAKVYTLEEKNSWIEIGFELTDYKDLPEEIKTSFLQAPGYAMSTTLAKNSGICIPSFVGSLPFPDDVEILKRVGKVFEQAYIRFLDLKKAEAQAREAHIEAAVERVRAEAMAMHSTLDFEKVTQQLLKQVKILDPDRFTGASICLIDEDQFFTWWDFSSPGSMADPESLNLRYDAKKYKILGMDVLKKWQAGENYMVFDYDLELLNAAVKEWEDLNADIANTFKKAISEGKLKHQWNPCGRLSNGFLAFDMIQPPDDDVRKITIKMAHAFEQANTRFFDLQKAEAQAREAKIEAALEKVRTRTMAMQKGEELQDVAVLLYKELITLGVTNFVSCGYVEINEKVNKQYVWITSPGGDSLGLFYLPLTGDATFDERYAAWKRQQVIFHQTVAGEVRSNHLEFAITTFNSKEAEEMVRSQFPDPTVFYCFNFSHGYLHLVTGSLLKQEEEMLLARFTRVFEQTYARFLDLKKAEAQAREAIKQAALERVRGEIASMRSANDLEIITPLVWRELTNLGIPFIRCGVFIVDDKKESVEVHLSSPDGKPLAAMHLAFDANDLTLHAVEAWKKNAVHVQQWGKADFINYGKLMVTQGQVKDLQSYQGDAAAPESLYLHFIPFSQGLLYVGSLRPLLAEEIQLVTLLAKSFAIAYARYEDFIKLEQAKAEVESAMSVLKATQSQLVQQEKLASLGQLTAGIAHEIKNPLNFVNNFTEVSIELIEEAIAEIQKNDNDKDSSLIDHNLDDIKANLKKVYEHGTRANSIVNAMLLHSRGGGGAPEPTLLNDFIREYSNLAFHGMRAGKDPLDVQVVLDLDEKIKEIPLIGEDFSRVVLNICNNAFDAMREKFTKYEVQSTKLEGGEDHRRHYVPTLSIQTRLENGKVCIQFEDNGPGIPDANRDKILQPFFTTKKGTEGTGLGLSISHDIVKAHGGTIKVETEVGKGTVFIIILPDNNF